MAERRVLRFKDFVLEEGEIWDAVCHGVKAFKQKRKQQAKKSEAKKLGDAVLNAEGADLRRLVKQIVDKGYTVKNEVVKPSRIKHMNKEVLECIRTRKASA
jgi:hypothetical protein